MKKKLLIILGSGSSIPLGMPSVLKLDELMKQWAREWTTDKPGCPDYFNVLWSAAEAYHRQGPVSSVRPHVNFEKVLGDMAGLSHWVSPAPWGDTLRQVVSKGKLPPDLPFPEPEAYGPRILVSDQLAWLSTKLAHYMRGVCNTSDDHADVAQQYRLLFEKLRQAFDIGVFNLNYDTAALAAWPEAYTGFDGKGMFEPGGVHGRHNWNFVYHLHGSVHHSLSGQSSEQICWRRNLGGDFFDGNPGLSTERRSDNRPFARTTLVAGGYKLDQLLVEPFQSFQSALVRHCYTADAILIGGYGFGDVHVNRALRNRLALPGWRPPTMVLARAEQNTEPMMRRHDLWAVELCEALAANDWFFREVGATWSRTPHELAGAGAFEVETQHNVALWYGGFIEAAQRVRDIIAWLNGESGDVLAPSSNMRTN